MKILSLVRVAAAAGCLASSGVAAAQDVAPAGSAPATATTTPASASTGDPSAFTLPAPETRSPVNRPLMVTSFVLLGGTYAASAIDAATSGHDSDHKYLYYPVVGPWLDLGNRGCTGARPCDNETANTALLILDGVGQGLGAVGLIASLFIPESATHHWYIIGGRGVHASPMKVGAGYGLGAVGDF